MKRLLLLYKKLSFWPILLSGIVLLLSILNYTPNTWLTGWDTLHPEFNLGLNFQRILSGVWRTEQGLGTVAGHAQMAELPRLIFLFLSSLVLSISFLRYFYFFVCLLLGPLGVYFFLKKWILDKKTGSEIGSFLGGLFYLLNLGTLQHFYAPFEMFAALYAALPWLLLLAAKFLNEGKRKHLTWFAITTFLAAPMAYASALWFVYLAFFGLFLVSFWVFERKLVNFKRAVVLVLLTLFVNSFWLLPNLYFLKTAAKDVPLAKINLMFSDKAFSYDLKYATLDNAFLLKGFLFDWQKYEKGEFSNLLAGWQNHLKTIPVVVIGYCLFALVLLGIIISLRKKDKRTLILIPGLVLTFIFLIHGVFGLETVFNFLREKIDIFKEAFRFFWSKFSLPVIFSFAIFFGFGLSNFFGILKRKLRLVAVLLVSILLIIWMWPAFRGEFISPHLRIKIPDEYFQTFSYFESQSECERIAVLPVVSNMGWEYYRWGFEGAGFIWFGLKQPILVRDFDRWESGNENFYSEFSYAIYSNNISLVESTLEKYQINWLLIDENLLSPAWPKALFTDEIEQLLSGSNKFNLVKSFGKIKIYKVALQTPVKDFVFVQDLKEIGPVYKWNNFDKAYVENGSYAYVENGNYVTSTEYKVQSTKWNVYYPFRSLFTGRKTDELDFGIKDLGDSFIFRKELPAEIVGGDILVPFYEPDELLFVDPNDLSNRKYFLPEVNFTGSFIEVKFPKIWGYFSADIASTGRKESLDKTESAAFYLPNLPHDLSYLISVESKNIEGKNLLFWLENLNLRRPDMEVYLSRVKERESGRVEVNYLIQPPMEKDGAGYSLHFDNISIGRQKTINELGKVTVNLLPYKFLTKLTLLSRGGESVPPTRWKTIVYSQAYDEGWHAYSVNSNNQITNSKLFAPVLGKELKNHVLVNNWENGWVIDESVNVDNVVFVYLPQYLEYLGFGLLVGSFIILLYHSS